MVWVFSAAATLWDEPAIDDRPERARRDVVLAALVAIGTTAEVLFRTDLVWPGLALVFGCGLAAAVVVRRQRPLDTVLFAFGGFAAIDVATGLAGADPFVLYSGSVALVFVFTLFRWASARDAAVGLVAMAAALVSSSIVDFNGVGDVVGGAAVLLLVAVLAATIRARRLVRDQLVQQAKADERQQIARELHDTVAHHVSAISVQARAGLVEVDSGSLTGAAGALQVIADEATRTLTEMRSMVGVLRNGQDRGAGSMSWSTEELLARSVPGTTVTVDVSGDLDEVAPMVTAALSRVAQESVTNALRHARQASAIDVRVDLSPSDVTLVVSDDGQASGQSGPPGHGLAGMGERVELLGGDFAAGPTPPGGWTVRAVLPR